MTQAEFARDRGVSRAAVSQWKAKDILREDAFTEPGKSGKIIYHVAVEQVRRNRDIGQSLGNGIATRTTAGDAPDAAPQDPPVPQPAQIVAAPAPQPVQPDLPQAPPSEAGAGSGGSGGGPAVPKADTVEDQLKRAKLEEQLRRNRMQAADEALRQGQLMDAGDARDQMARIAGMMMQIFEGALPDFAAAVAAQFEVPQRDVLHLLRGEFKKVRATAAQKERARAEDTDRTGGTWVEADA